MLTYVLIRINDESNINISEGWNKRVVPKECFYLLSKGKSPTHNELNKRRYNLLRGI